MSAQLDVIPNCSGGHEPQNEEFSYWVDENQNACIEGVIPANLTGTFFRNGPGRLKLDKDKFGHWFDGDGML
jgi:all-trans-8'-apo-beta-carotenal 15,15'-oxygenase